MSVMVYPRLGDVLKSKNVTVAELERQIRERFDVAVDPMALYGMLLDDEPIKRVDLDVVGAVAAVLHVPLDDLFTVETTPNGAHTLLEEEEPILGPEDSRRMGELFDQATPSGAESVELQQLVAKYSRLLHERRVHEIAQKRGVPEGQVRRETAVAVAETLDWLRAFDAAPRYREELAAQVAQHRARQGTRQGE